MYVTFDHDDFMPIKRAYIRHKIKSVASTVVFTDDMIWPRIVRQHHWCKLPMDAIVNVLCKTMSARIVMNTSCSVVKHCVVS